MSIKELKIANFKVRTKADMKQLTELAITSLVNETNFRDPEIAKTIERGVLDVVSSEYTLEPKDDIKKNGSTYPTLFRYLRQQTSSAPKTSKAILSSAGWFYYNMEKPQQKNAKIARYGIDEDNLIFKEQKKKYQRSKYMQWGVLGLSVIAGTTMLFFGLKPKKKAKNPRRLTSNGAGKVSRSKTKKRNRKNR